MIAAFLVNSPSSLLFFFLLLLLPLFYFFFVGLRYQFRTASFLTVFLGICLVSFGVFLDFTEGGDLFKTYPILRADDPLHDVFKLIVGALFGMLLVVVGSIQEVRYRLHREQEAKREGALEHAIVQSMGAGVVVVDDTNRILTLNPAAERLLGVTAEQTQGKLLAELLPEGREDVKVLVGAEARPDEHRPFARPRADQERQGVMQEVGERVLSIDTQPIETDEGDIRGAVSSLHDVTLLAQLDKMKSDFVSTVSHELRTPLTSIQGYIDLLVDEVEGNLNQTQREYLAVAQKHTSRLIEMVNNFLDLSRIEAGMLRIQKQPLNLSNLVEEAAENLRHDFDEKQIHFTGEQRDYPLWVIGDRSRLMQVLNNLLSNALKYTQRGGSVKIVSERKSGQVVVHVRDTGVGIPLEEQQKLFTKFYRVEQQETEAMVGSGLGLAIAKSIVELHEGKIWLRSKPGKGSTFSFSLPAASGTSIGEAEPLAAEAS